MHSYLEPALYRVPKLLRHLAARVLDLEVAPFLSNLLGREWPASVPPSRIVPPLLYSLNLSLVCLFLLIDVRHDDYGMSRRTVIKIVLIEL